MALEAFSSSASLVGTLNGGVTSVDRSLLLKQGNVQVAAVKQLESGFKSRIDEALAELDAKISSPKIEGLQREQSLLISRKERINSGVEVVNKSLFQITFLKGALEEMDAKLKEVQAGSLSTSDFATFWDNAIRKININVEDASISLKSGGVESQQNLIKANSRTSFSSQTFVAPYSARGETLTIAGSYLGTDYFLIENGGSKFWNSNTGFLSSEEATGTLSEFSSQAGFSSSPTGRSESVTRIDPPVILVERFTDGLSSNAITAIGGDGDTGSSPSGQEVAKQFDNNLATKYANTDGANSGAQIDLGTARRADRLRLFTADNLPASDPASFSILGSNDGSNFTSIVSARSLTAPTTRQTTYGDIDFSNLEKFRFYKIIFDSVRIPTTISDHTTSLSTNAFTPVGTSGIGTSPIGQEVEKAFDESTSTSYRNNDGAGSGVLINLGSAKTANSLLLTTSASNSERDPTSFSVFGSNDGTSFTTIASNQSLSAPSGRATAYAEADFNNSTAFQFYKVTFPSVRSSGQALQIGEIGLNSSADVDDHTDGLSTSAYTAIGGNGDVGSSPSNERVHRAFDNNVGTKYLNFDRLNSGALINLGSAKKVNKLGLTTANDAVNRDPTSFSLFGSNDGTSFTTIVSNQSLSPPTTRHTNYPDVTFSNNNSFQFYKLIFPTIRSFGGANSVQISEIRLAEEVTPEDLLTGLSNRYNQIASNGTDTGVSSTGEDVSKAFDGSTSTKYSQSNGAGSSVVIDLGSSQLVDTLGLTTANGSTNEDPTNYSLLGSNDGTSFTSIVSSRSLTAPENRQTAYEDTFTEINSSFFRFYKLTFNTVRSGSALAVSDIRLGVQAADRVHISKTNLGVVDQTLDEGQISFTPTGAGSSNTYNITRGGLKLLDAWAYKNFSTANLKNHAKYDIHSALGLVLGAEAEYRTDLATLQSRATVFDPVIAGIESEIGQLTETSLSEKQAKFRALQLQFQVAKLGFALLAARGNALVTTMVLSQDSFVGGPGSTFKRTGEALLGTTLSISV